MFRFWDSSLISPVICYKGSFSEIRIRIVISHFHNTRFLIPVINPLQIMRLLCIIDIQVFGDWALIEIRFHNFLLGIFNGRRIFEKIEIGSFCKRNIEFEIYFIINFESWLSFVRFSLKDISAI